MTNFLDNGKAHGAVIAEQTFDTTQGTRKYAVDWQTKCVVLDFDNDLYGNAPAGTIAIYVGENTAGLPWAIVTAGEMRVRPIAISGAGSVLTIVPSANAVGLLHVQLCAEVVGVGRYRPSSGGGGVVTSTAKIVQTAQSPNATASSATATFANAPAVGDLVLGFVSAQDQYTWQIGFPSKLAMLNTRDGGGNSNDQSALLFGIGDGVTKAFTVTGNANGINLVMFDISQWVKFGRESALIQPVSPLMLPPLFTPAQKCLAFFGIPYDNAVPVLTPPAGWSTIVAGGAHAIAVAYATIANAGLVRPSIASTNLGGFNASIGVWVQ
jgi:hypothetical protein